MAGEVNPPALGRRAEAALAAACAAITFLVFVPALRNGFVSYDDPIYRMDNPFLRGGFGLDALRSALLEFHAILWIPLTWASLGLDALLWGDRAFGYHLTSVLLHAASAALVFLLACRILRLRADARGEPVLSPAAVRAGALAAALSWSLHPLRVESVAWIVERKDVLSTLFVLLSTAAWLRFARRVRAGAPARGAYALSLACFVAALLSKSMVVTWPAILLLADVVLLRRVRDARELGRAALEKVPFLATSLAASALTAEAQRPVIRSLAQLSVPARLVNAAHSVLAYARDTAFPLWLGPFQQHPGDAVLRSPEHLLAVPAFLGLALLAAGQLRRRPWIPAAAGAYLVALLPAVGLVQAGPQARADRFTYLPSLVLALLAGAAVAHLAASAATAEAGRPRLPARAALCAGGLVLAAWSGLTVRQIGFWRDGVSFWTRAIELDPSLGIAYFERSKDWVARGEPAAALSDLSRSAEIAEEKRFSRRCKVYAARGELLLELGRPEEAIADYRRAVESCAPPEEEHVRALLDLEARPGRPGAGRGSGG